MYDDELLIRQHDGVEARDREGCAQLLHRAHDTVGDRAAEIADLLADEREVQLGVSRALDVAVGLGAEQLLENFDRDDRAVVREREFLFEERMRVDLRALVRVRREAKVHEARSRCILSERRFK